MRKLLQQLGLICLSALLFGCALTNEFTPNTTKQLDEKYITHHNKHYHSITDVASDADNVATQDYYQNQPDSQDDLWRAVREDFQLNHYENNPQVQAQIAWYMHNQGYLYRTARRAAPFMYYIYQEVKARNLPSELVLLPIIESAYNPFVSSYAGASGLWQIEPGTGRVFGLKQDFWYDGRKDVSTSTKAALDYLSYLQNFFGGDWLLAIAAYDTGEGNVEAAMRRNARAGYPTGYFSLRLSQETEAYVPRLLALAIIINDPRKYPVDLPPINNAPYLGQVDISSQISLEQVANLAGVSLTELKILNPGYKSDKLDPRQPYKLLLPIDRIPTFKRNLLSQTDNQSSGLWSRYKVQAKDTWRSISKRFNVSIDTIKSVNRLNTDTPPVGEILLIPESEKNKAALATALTQESSDSDNDSDTNTDNNTETHKTAASAPHKKIIHHKPAPKHTTKHHHPTH